MKLSLLLVLPISLALTAYAILPDGAEASNEFRTSGTPEPPVITDNDGFVSLAEWALQHESAIFYHIGWAIEDDTELSTEFEKVSGGTVAVDTQREAGETVNWFVQEHMLEVAIQMGKTPPKF